MTRQVIEIPSNGWATVVADPNWSYENYRKGGKAAKKAGGASGNYECASPEELKKIPIKKWLRKDAVVFLWVPCPQIENATLVWLEWGLAQVTAWPWVKTVPSRAEIAKGVGFWAHQPTELLVALRVRGSSRGPKQRPNKRVDGLLTGPHEHPVFYARGGSVHSRKPLSLIEWIENRNPGPYLELWATGKRPGWTCVGYETGWKLCGRGMVPREGGRGPK